VIRRCWGHRRTNPLPPPHDYKIIPGVLAYTAAAAASLGKNNTRLFRSRAIHRADLYVDETNGCAPVKTLIISCPGTTLAIHLGIRAA
jgi:precorrin-4 methylase